MSRREGLDRVPRRLINTVQFIWSHPLSRGRKLSKLAAYLRWQIGARGPRQFGIEDLVVDSAEKHGR